MAYRAPSANLREGSDGSGRPVGARDARPLTPDALPGGLPSPRLSADQKRIHGERRVARIARRGGRKIVLRGPRVARGIRDAWETTVMQNSKCKMQNEGSEGTEPRRS